MPTVCPQCGRAAPRKSTLHTSDGFHRILFYVAYRCRACRFRFWELNLLKPVWIAGILGLAIFVGWWMPKDERLSVEHASPSSPPQLAALAAQGDANAELQMGQRYADGNGVIKNDKEAARWYERAASHGHAEAQYRYGLALLDGRGVVQDYKAAFSWIEKPAKLGHANAQFSLGELYRYGTGTVLDKAQAYLWFNLAAAQGVEKAAKARDSLVWQLKPEQITAMQEAARDLSKYEAAASTPGIPSLTPSKSPLINH